MNIPDEAVEVAARALVWAQTHGCYEYQPEGSPKRDDLDRYAEVHARAALEAAAPILMAQAWDEGYEMRDTDSPHESDAINPYKVVP